MADIDELRLLVADQIREAAATSTVADNLIAECCGPNDATAAAWCCIRGSVVTLDLSMLQAARLLAQDSRVLWA